MILLVDGNGLCCRCWWANAVDVPQRFADAVEAARDDNECEDAVIAWDSPPPTWRHEVMPTYKARRPPKPELLTRAIADCRRLARFEHVSAAGYEADDILATLARQAEGGAIIMSEDKDMAQLVGPACWLLDYRGRLTTAAVVEARWGVPPDRIRYLLSWAGDSSDGLPGVRGVGAKRAIPHALNLEIGDALSFELAGLVDVPTDRLVTHGGPSW